MATVPKILNGKDQYINEATHQKVLEIVEREGYIPPLYLQLYMEEIFEYFCIIIADLYQCFNSTNYCIFYLECYWVSISRGQISNQRKGGFHEDYTYDR